MKHQFKNGTVCSILRTENREPSHDKESVVWSSELVVGIKVKTEAKMHEDKHDCNHFY